MKNHIKVLLLLTWLHSVVGRPIRCSLTRNIVRYDPKHPEAEIECIPCPDCPEGYGLSPQCGSRIPKYFKIECKPCLVNKTYSNNHGIGSCMPCQECHLKNVIQDCTVKENRICGIKCPQGRFLDHNNACQQCYFCCHNVSEAYRRQGCKDIGMDRNQQCEKTAQNQRCKKALEKVTITPTDTKPTGPHDHNHDMAENQSTSIPTSQKLTSSQYPNPSTPMASQGESKVAMLPSNDNSTNDLSAKKEKGQKKNGTAFLGVVFGVIGAVLVLVPGIYFLIKRARCNSSRTEPELDSTELSPLQSTGSCESEDSDRSTSQDQLTNALSVKEVGIKPNPADIPADKLTNAVSAKEVGITPNPANIFADRKVSDMERLCDEEGKVMFFHVQDLLDAVGKSNRRTWRSVGLALKVTPVDLDLIEADCKRAGGSPTESLLTKLKTFTKEPTMIEFVQALINCDRNDVANYICNWPWEIA